MKIEFKEGSSGSIDPWTLEKLLALGRNPIVTDDFVTWAKVGGRTFRVLPNTESRIDSGEDPEKVLMDALKVLRPGIKRVVQKFGVTIEIGVGDMDPRTAWSYMVSGKSYLTTGTYHHWIYYGDEDPFQINAFDYPQFCNDIDGVKNKEELDIIIELWKSK